MENLIGRIQVEVLESHLKKFPVVAVLGSRQVGKTTLVKNPLLSELSYTEGRNS